MLQINTNIHEGRARLAGVAAAHVGEGGRLVVEGELEYLEPPERLRRHVRKQPVKHGLQEVHYPPLKAPLGMKDARTSLCCKEVRSLAAHIQLNIQRGAGLPQLCDAIKTLEYI
eukprot:scaffold66809_cov26-Prasinocladus_malaysianus.AAC.1